KREEVPGLPVPSVSPALAGQVAIDETILAMAMGPNRFPRRSDYERVGEELAQARALFAGNGWLDDPATYHPRPPDLRSPSIDRGWALGQRYERLLFPSEWEPHPGEPGAERWAGYDANHTAVATVLRHPGPPRPWVVAIHGFACGYPFMDFVGLHALHLHRDLGLNVVMPVLPLHGPRKINRFSGEEFLSFDLINTVHGLTQAVWDIRQILSWVRAQDAPAIAVYGVSLGGYVTALLAGLEDGLDAAVAGIPVVDFPAMFRHQSPIHIRLRAVEHEILDGNAEVVHRVISPLALEPRVARDRRFIYAGLGDRMAPPTQAHLLWKHWEEPEICWYAGNHVGYLWSKQVTSFLGRSLVTAGLVTADR
ncbi:MAG TPA: alpha/beta hydrolase, partial [Acidimicrobiales bacterium]